MDSSDDSAAVDSPHRTPDDSSGLHTGLQMILMDSTRPQMILATLAHATPDDSRGGLHTDSDDSGGLHMNSTCGLTDPHWTVGGVHIGAVSGAPDDLQMT